MCFSPSCIPLMTQDRRLRNQLKERKMDRYEVRLRDREIKREKGEEDRLDCNLKIGKEKRGMR